MKSIVTKLLVGAATLAIASTPLVASAEDWHHDNGRGEHERYVHRDDRYRESFRRPVYHRYHEGYYGYAPGGFNGYYHNGGWYRHRRPQAGIWIYF
jgi:hypothetical protein